jgi:hypothetical protein
MDGNKPSPPLPCHLCGKSGHLEKYYLDARKIGFLVSNNFYQEKEKDDTDKIE